MKYPKHSDPRTYHLFSSGYCGNRAGDVLPHECAKDREGGTACVKCIRGGESRSDYSTHFDNMTTEIGPSTMVSTSYQTNFCVYCGNRAHTLQYRNFEVRGYTCTCKGACDEREYEAAREAMRMRHHKEVQDMEKAAPPRSKEVIAAVWKREAAAVLKDIEGGSIPRALERLGIIVGDVEDS